MDSLDAYKKVKASANEKKRAETRVMGAMGVNDAVRQGDIYIKYIGDVPRGAERIKSPDAQLVPGTSRGSRHAITAESLCRCTLYSKANPTALDGPVIEAAGPFEVAHPEHGNFIFPAGVYSVTYQRSFAEDLKRVVD